MDKDFLGIISMENAQHYQWGDHCDGWHLVKLDNLSVIKEKMPTKTAERLHYHQHSHQFFFILLGEAEFEIDGKIFKVGQNEGISIQPGMKHKIQNNSDSNLEFIVVSQPKSLGDRINI
jgi:mannose-6-phosphate isomerase-like protein (cupin superfamily)